MKLIKTFLFWVMMVGTIGWVILIFPFIFTSDETNLTGLLSISISLSVMGYLGYGYATRDENKEAAEFLKAIHICKCGICGETYGRQGSISEQE